jgi:hypothetical protein
VESSRSSELEEGELGELGAEVSCPFKSVGLIVDVRQKRVVNVFTSFGWFGCSALVAKQ